MSRVLTLASLLLISAAAMAQTSILRPAITAISHITLYADDLAKSQKFYGSLIGWEQMPEGAQRSGLRFYANHFQYIRLVLAPRPGIDDRLIDVGFVTKDAEALRQFLHENGVTVPDAVRKDSDGGKHFDVADPEGNKIEFVQAGTPFAKPPQSTSQQLSSHIIHVGFVVRNRELVDHFYKDLLGFHLYWQGGASAGHTDWVMMQVPDGTDWLEYMLYLPAAPTRGQLGSANHFSPGVSSVAELTEKLRRRGWVPSEGEHLSLLGVDGKLQLAMVDPDGTRAEFMEFAPVKKPCCALYTGPQPTPSTDW